MNIKIEKVDVNNIEATTFLSEENLKMFLELNPQFLSLFQDKIKEYADNAFKARFMKGLDKEATIYAAYFDDEIIGCGFIDGKGYLNSLFVKEEYRNQSIGTKLLEKLIQDCSQFAVIRVDAKIKAISLYEKFSFHRVAGISNVAFVPMELERSHYGK